MVLQGVGKSQVSLYIQEATTGIYVWALELRCPWSGLGCTVNNAYRWDVFEFYNSEIFLLIIYMSMLIRKCYNTISWPTEIVQSSFKNNFLAVDEAITDSQVVDMDLKITGAPIPYTHSVCPVMEVTSWSVMYGSVIKLMMDRWTETDHREISHSSSPVLLIIFVKTKWLLDIGSSICRKRTHRSSKNLPTVINVNIQLTVILKDYTCIFSYIY